MTVIELFDNSPLENVISFIAYHEEQLDRIVYLGDPRKMDEQKAGIENYLRHVNPEIQTEYRKIEQNNVDALTVMLKKLVQEFGAENCVFDLTGGDDLVLFAMGMVYEQYKDLGVRVHKFNIHSGRIAERRFDTCESHLPSVSLSVEEQILLHGGKIITKDDREDGTRTWNFSPDFVSDLEKMWEICRKDCGLWNTQISMVDTLLHDAGMGSPSDPLLLSIPFYTAENVLKRHGQKYFTGRVFLSLYKAGLLTEYQGGKKELRLRFKNEQVKECLSVAGTVLELITCYHASVLKGHSSGKIRFQDVLAGVRIDWDGKIHSPKSNVIDVENEIDVILMSGLTPIFISCKNGNFDTNELYKFDTVVARFGGKHARKVLICTDAKIKPHIKERADELGIQMIENVNQKSFSEFSSILRKITV